jgi:hypothetical protein
MRGGGCIAEEHPLLIVVAAVLLLLRVWLYAEAIIITQSPSMSTCHISLL